MLSLFLFCNRNLVLASCLSLKYKSKICFRCMICFFLCLMQRFFWNNRCLCKIIFIIIHFSLVRYLKKQKQRKHSLPTTSYASRPIDGITFTYTSCPAIIFIHEKPIRATTKNMAKNNKPANILGVI